MIFNIFVFLILLMPELVVNVPSNMRATLQSSYREARQVLTVKEGVPTPSDLSPKQVLVRVCAASINPIDWKMLKGNFSLLVKRSFPHIPGKDIAGEVVATGTQAKKFKIGDKVYGTLQPCDGSFAEYARCDESMISFKPSNLSMVEAAAVPLACGTSYQALFKRVTPPVSKDTKILILGGATATGLYALQLARAVGATVTVTSSLRNLPLFEKLGLEPVDTKSGPNDSEKRLFYINYREKDFGVELKGENYDVVYDCIGGNEHFKAAKNVLKPGGSFITIVGDDKTSVISVKSLICTAFQLFQRNICAFFTNCGQKYIFHLFSPTQKTLDEIREKFVETGKVIPLIDSVFDWQRDGTEAVHMLYDKCKSGAAQGKLVLKISD